MRYGIQGNCPVPGKEIYKNNALAICEKLRKKIRSFSQIAGSLEKKFEASRKLREASK
jgi:hypothetical protein